MDAAAWGIGWQSRTAIPCRSDDVEEASQNRISDGNRHGRTGRAHFRVARETRSRLKRDAADYHGIDVTVHFEDRSKIAVFDHLIGAGGTQRAVHIGKGGPNAVPQEEA